MKTQVNSPKPNMRKSRKYHRTWEPDQDRFAPDGVICYGNRLVRKGGVVLFGGRRWKHEKLKDMVGFYVACAPDDYFFTCINIDFMNCYPGGMTGICTIRSSFIKY